MITCQQLHIYRTHWGDQELFYYREGMPAEIEALPQAAWQLITQLIQAAHRLETAPAAPDAAELRAKIQQHTADDATRRLLRKLGRAYPRIRPRWPLFLFQSLILGILMVVFLIADGLAALLAWLDGSPVRRWVGKLLLLVIGWLLYKLGTDYLLRWLKS